MNLITRDIDVALLRTFVSVVDAGSMTGAANAQNLTQAAVSQQIKRLEDLFRDQLFDRSQRQVRLTSTGQRLLSHAKRLVTLNDEVWSAMTAPEFDGEVNMGVPHDIFKPFMPSILRAFSKACPNVNLVLHSSPTSTLLEGLHAGELDVVLTTEPMPGKEMLLADSLVWAGVKGGLAYSQNPLPVALGHDECAFKEYALQALSAEGIDWKLSCHVGSNDPIVALLEADLGVAPFMAHTVPEGLEIVPYDRLPGLPPFYINMYLKAGMNDPATLELAQHIRAEFASRYSAAA
ncbi:MAG: LysR family transcriptional regulator [Rhizobiaceae bacterium]|nr:LysR family transcriptional regulator [Rhizobiaceae bacterium]